ncbi:probable arabinosyltransferase ARAD1 [Spinacia oleracea]|uniref:Probable arabinosyltransferase ARAD1 n=1 Tax=Spinacia oleracea TaxID=3562 RepID=A0A9R0KCA2_SPIOL|nr:probable arabinosyltransferase ARAD1 [Spinacia oleracea]
MLEKSMPTSRLLLSITAFSMFFLIISSFFLFHSVINPFIPSSVFKQFVVESEPIDYTPDYKPEGNNEQPIEQPLVVPLPPSSISMIELDTHNKVEEAMPIDPHEATSLNKKIDVHVLSKKEACNPNKALLKVYMYDMPREFHFGLLDWKASPNQIWPNVSDIKHVPRYPGGLNLQHSMEYWLTLDLLSSNVKKIVRPCSVIRVENPSQADFIFVPFFASLSYNRFSKVLGKEKVSLNRRLQDQLVDFLLSRPEWIKSGGKDHIIVAHHPNSLLYVRKKLGSARFILADFGRYVAKTANLNKDVIAPYQHVVPSISNNNSAPFEQRPTLAFFQGAIYRKDGGAIRQELFYLLKDEKDVHFAFGSAQKSGVREARNGMGSSKFCLNIAGDTPSSNRLFDAIVSHCVPVIISDNIELPYEDVLDYSEFSVLVWGSYAVKPGFLVNLLKGIKRDEWMKMWEKLKEVAHHFEYQYPSQPGDAVDMTWQALARKKSGVKMKRIDRRYRMP